MTRMFARFIKTLLRVTTIIASSLVMGCGQSDFLPDAVTATASSSGMSGNIIIVSGGTVARTATPFPRHEIIEFSPNGSYKSTLYSALSTEFLMGAAYRSSDDSLLVAVDTTDRVDRIPFSNRIPVLNLLDVVNLTGVTMRGIAVLNDGGSLIMESTTSIEKYTSAGVRIAVNYPKVCGAVNLMHVRKISGGRWVMVCTGLTSGTDAPRVYNDDGTAGTPTTFSGAPCGVNCDPSDIVELPNGNFVVSMQITHSLEMFGPTGTYLGRAFLDTTVLQTPSAMALLKNGNIIVCSTAFDNCEQFSINGITATRVGSKAFISDDLIRQPTDVLVIP